MSYLSVFQKIKKTRIDSRYHNSKHLMILVGSEESPEWMCKPWTNVQGVGDVLSEGYWGLCQGQEMGQEFFWSKYSVYQWLASVYKS